MIHLDTNILIDLVTVHSAQLEMVRRWLEGGKEFAASAIAWSEFCNGPYTCGQKDAVRCILKGGVCSFTEGEAEDASRLFHYTGRRRGSHADCMIAAAAMFHKSPVATRNIQDFEKFVPYGLMLKRVPTV